MRRSGSGAAPPGPVGVRLVCVAVLWAATAIAFAAPARAEVPVLHLDGRGFGHGVGLAQWGARYAADAGADAASILTTFYPGTALGEAGGAVRVAVHAGPDAVLSFPQGGEIRSPLVGDQAEGFPVAVAPGALVSVRPEGSGFRVEHVLVAQSTSRPVMLAQQGDCIPLLGPCPPPDGGGGGGGDCSLGCAPAPTTAPPPAPAPTQPTPPPNEAPPNEAPPETAPPSPQPGDGSAGAVSPASVWAVPAGDSVSTITARGRSYRGVLEAVGDPAGLRLVNQLDVEQYLKGMAEVPATWPAAAQQAQAIAARTYVLRAMAASGEVCDHERCQVYVGATREAPGQDAAVEATRGTVLTFGGALAASVYSADAGGITATPTEGFGAGSPAYPYLTNVRYDTPDPLPWATDVAVADVAARFAYPGTISVVRIAEAGPSGRAVQVALEGDAGTRLVDGPTFARRLGLRSTLFTPTMGSAAVAPAAPPLDGIEEPMALPDDVDAMAAAIGRTGAAPSTPLGVGDTMTIDLLPGRDLGGHPATLAALAGLAAVTAAGMTWGGGYERALWLLANRRWRGMRRSHP